MDYLQTQDVRFSYDEDESGIVEVLKGVTLGIQKGDFHCWAIMVPVNRPLQNILTQFYCQAAAKYMWIPWIPQMTVSNLKSENVSV